MSQEQDDAPVDLQVEVGVESMDDDSNDMMPLDRFVPPPNADAVVSLWREKMAQGTLTPTHFQDHWRVTVPRLYSPQPIKRCVDWSFDEEIEPKLLLIQPLEQFIWGGDASLQAPRRSALCGRVFKPGEPAYSCRECSMDNTCVFCVECFKVSAHRQHKYKMGQSGGGGCCDCGDTEAWKRDPFCDNHKIAVENESNETSIAPDVIERMKIVASVSLSYCFRILTMEHSPTLPNDLRLKDAEKDPMQILDQPDCYCTVLYNDETHTFDQVIQTLTRVMKFVHRDSVELTSLIDREGRAIVKCNSFQICDKLKTDIEIHSAMFERFTSRHGASLKVLVTHAHLIAHQIFAMKLLNWLQAFVAKEPSLRTAVSQIALGEESAFSGSMTGALSLGGGVAMGVMLNDCRMWKAARNSWHRLLIATTLMDYASKKSMAILFTKNYGSILKDFMRDDHDHSFSISSLSVQLFTTPTLAHHLIAKHDALFVLFNAFLSECNRLCQKGRLEFERNKVPQSFKRAQFILYDVKYLLGSVPTTFDDELRKGFLHGLSLMLNLLGMMQGMDSVIRQVGQHMEYEPEWETAFNLHVKFAHTITLALEWCAAERQLAASAYRMALRRHADLPININTVVKELGSQSASVIPYDVSKDPVSIHQPLSRFIAGLHLCLHKHGLDYRSKEFDMLDRMKPSPEELIEPVLRTVAMIAQVHAGMWRRNGFALLNQLYFYHNVKCRPEMRDRDVCMLQIGASLIESNEFIIHVLNKFNLVEWASEEYDSIAPEEDTLRQTIAMVEEMLEMLITVVGTRYVPGVGEVTNEDRIKKEIIQMLCIKSMPHSELNKCLPEDQLHETGLESVINDVADFTKPPGGNNRGVYKLKPHLYDEYDTFFYHYCKEDLSRSEEEQRKRRKTAGLAECCPPPPLPKLCPPFRLLANLLQCDASLHVLKCVLRRALDLRARNFSETQLHKALHLIGYALRDEEGGNYEFLAFSEKLQRSGILSLLQQLATSARVEAHRPLVKWTLTYVKKLLSQSGESSVDKESMETDQEDKPSSDNAEAERAKRAKLAAERRVKLMAQMHSQMNNFISNNATLFAQTNTEVTAEEQNIKELYCENEAGKKTLVPEQSRVCIMCQEEAILDESGEPIVIVAFVQHSTVMNRLRVEENGLVPEKWGRGYLPAGVGAQPHVSSCGHALHARCWQKCVDNIFDKENKRPNRHRQPAAFDVEKKEYLCPLCERLCNTALPLLPSPKLPEGNLTLTEDTYAKSIELVLKHQVISEDASEICDEKCEEMHCQARARSVGAMSSDMEDDDEPPPIMYMLTHSMKYLPKDFMLHFDDKLPVYNEAMMVLVNDFLEVLPQVCGVSLANSMTWIGLLYRSTSYSIMSANAVLLVEKRPLLGELPARQRDALQTLVRLARSLPAKWPPTQIAHHAIDALNTLEKSSPLDHELFGTLVTLALSMPSLFNKNSAPATLSSLTKHIIMQCLRAQLVKSMILLDFSNCNSEPMDSEDDFKSKQDLDGLLEFVSDVRKRDLDILKLNVNDVWEKIKSQCFNFLRCSCLFIYFLSDIQCNPELARQGGDNWETMCAYLELPSTFKELLNNGLAKRKAIEWCRMVPELMLSAEILLEPSEPPKLIDLPEDFSELMNIVSEFSCPNSEREDCKYPTMCLVCGKILCSQSYCCQTELIRTSRRGRRVSSLVGAGTAHAWRCGGGAGALVRVRDCELLLLAAPGKGALQPAPYADRYGETDQCLRRGNPLHLCPDRFNEVRMLWLSHSIYERIARSLDTTLLVDNTQWHNM